MCLDTMRLLEARPTSIAPGAASEPSLDPRLARPAAMTDEEEVGAQVEDDGVGHSAAPNHHGEGDGVEHSTAP